MPQPALDIMAVFVSEDDRPMVDAHNQIAAFVADMEKRHEPLTGEAYPQDRNRYCAVCISGDGGSARWPCGTIRAVRKFLCADAGKTSKTKKES